MFFGFVFVLDWLLVCYVFVEVVWFVCWFYLVCCCLCFFFIFRLGWFDVLCWFLGMLFVWCGCLCFLNLLVGLGLCVVGIVWFFLVWVCFRFIVWLVVWFYWFWFFGFVRFYRMSLGLCSVCWYICVVFFWLFCEVYFVCFWGDWRGWCILFSFFLGCLFLDFGIGLMCLFV